MHIEIMLLSVYCMLLFPNRSSDYVTTDRLNECGVKCVEDYTVCQSFAYDSSTSLCQLYQSTVGVSGSVTRSNTVQYYEAIPGQVFVAQ